MALQAFEAHVCAKAEARGNYSRKHLAKSNGPSFLLFLSCFVANQMGFEQGLNNLAFNGMDGLKKKIYRFIDL